jgi:hypothetical protein
MSVSLVMAASGFEPVYTWLEAHPGAPVAVWGLDHGRRAALLAYSTGADDAFGWSDWAGRVLEDPSEILAGFEQLDLEFQDDALPRQLQFAFPGVFTAPSAAART